MTTRLSVAVEGIDAESIVAEVETAVRESLETLGLPGPWHVAVRPSLVGGRWDFNVQGLDVRHILSISAQATQLPDLIPERLTASLSRIMCTKVEAAAERVLALRRVG